MICGMPGRGEVEGEGEEGEGEEGEGEEGEGTLSIKI